MHYLRANNHAHLHINTASTTTNLHTHTNTHYATWGFSFLFRLQIEYNTSEKTSKEKMINYLCKIKSNREDRNVHVRMGNNNLISRWVSDGTGVSAWWIFWAACVKSSCGCQDSPDSHSLMINFPSSIPWPALTRRRPSNRSKYSEWLNAFSSQGTLSTEMASQKVN